MKWKWYDWAAVICAVALVTGILWLFIPVLTYFFPPIQPSLPVLNEKVSSVEISSNEILLSDQAGAVDSIKDVPKSGGWINSLPLDLKKLQEENKIVIVDFWTNGCINCQRDSPHTQALWEKYKDHGLVIIGVHTPEFAWESEPEKILEFVEEYEVTYPILTDSDKKIWKSFGNHYWPGKYLIDQNGKIIYTHFGEGDYEEQEAVVRKALKDAGWEV